MGFTDFQQIKGLFKGDFLVDPAVIYDKLSKVKAYVFDWDGVFNMGEKNENGSSPYNEVDSMGINMFRFNHYIRTGQNPIVAVVTGERNASAFALAQREHFHSVYYKIKHKADALAHLCDAHSIQSSEVAFFFDDVLDLSVSAICGLRIMIGHDCNPMFLNLVKENNFADYITHCNGQNGAIREASELLMGLTGRYDETIMQRVHLTDQYAAYLERRNNPDAKFYTSIDSKITEVS
jgi:3-deoxy-D-manno-octulosonate 8-phosphate phosphatase (KDO 8-P phosphatase)